MLAPERWARIRTLLAEVAALPPDDRDAYLTRTCAGQSDVRAEVESLLRAGDDADGWLEPPAGPPIVETTTTPAPDLAPGARLGVFEIIGPLGVGGMGRVYRARDTRLGRTVALKVLAPELSHLPASQARFEREARALSSLNHPHICVLHDVGRATLDDGGEQLFLVTELIEGETLAARLARGPLPVALALQYATQIADALDAAHRQGIIHRDLKPANVMLTKTAGVKLLDFGLARLRRPEERPASTVAPSTQTQSGTVAGTLPYMAPEQVRGEEADARSDLFAFGAVLYEMLAGERPFDADTPTALMVQILERDPPPLADRAPHVPIALDRLIRTCLAKDPADRWQHAHDVVLTLRGIGERENDVRERVPSPSPRVSRWLWAALGAGATAAAIAIVAWDGRPPTPREGAPRVLAAMPLPAGFVPGARKGPWLAISPDGRRVALVGRWGGRPQVWIRPMDGATLTPVQGTEDADGVFWAPDSQRIGFTSHETLRTVAVSGGPVQTLCDGLYSTWGGTWGSQGVIVFAHEGRLHRIPERGGRPEPVVLEGAADDVRYSQPSFLPDGRRFLFAADGRDTYDIGLGSLDGGDVVPLVEDADVYTPNYAAGHLLFARQGDLLAMPFDVQTGSVTAPPRTVAALNARGYASSDAGTVVALPDEPKELGFRMPDGAPGTTLGPSDDYRQLALSASGAKAAVVKQNVDKRNEMWVVNLATSAWTRLDPHVGRTNEPTHMRDPVWGPDDRRLAFSALDRGFIRDLSTGVDEIIADLPTLYYIDDWTPDGSAIVFHSFQSDRAAIVTWVASPGAAGDHRELVRPPVLRDQVHVSPDGRWCAYNALDSGEWEVYTARFPSFTDAQQVSAARGGVQPVWAHDGQRLFYLRLDGTMMAVDLRRDGEVLVAAAPRALFNTRLTNPAAWVSQYDVAKDGRFLIMERAPGPYTLTVLMNWAPAGS